MGKDKWEKCKTLEREWWTRWKSRADMAKVREDLLARANRIGKVLRIHFPSGGSLRILQIGPGANGEVHFMSGERYAIDPHATFFKENFSELIDPEVKFVDGMGEELPYKDSYFDAILIINVLDHCKDPDKVLQEIYRCLRSNGILILEVNIYGKVASALHALFNFIDREHPHAVTLDHIRKRLSGGYEILEKHSAYIPLPEYDILKKTFLIFLRMLGLAPIAFKLAVMKK
jgi:SAM-dependent methyltransferase